MMTKTKPKRVFVIEKFRQNFDMSSVDKYGKIVTLIDSNVRRPSIFDVDLFQEAVLRLFEKHEFDPERDSVCVVGALITVVLTTSVLVERYGSINVLLYNSSQGEYVLRPLGGLHECAK